VKRLATIAAAFPDACGKVCVLAVGRIAAECAQDTWIIEIETPVPPLSPSRNANQHIQCTT